MDMKATKNSTVVLIATLPKSGTWYARIFFWCYDQLLQHTEDYLQGNFKLDLVNALANRNIPETSTHQSTFCVDRLFTCHSVCPGFSENHEVNYPLWKALNYCAAAYNGGETLIRHHGEWDALNPKMNINSRIVYLYRNPLDHLVSYYRHVHHHVDEKQRSKLLPDGTQVLIKDFHDFVFGYDKLSAFIKHYYSYKQMQIRYPQQVMLVSYEELMFNPYHVFYKILSFIGSPPNTSAKLQQFNEALALAEKDSLMAVEAVLNRSFVGDQIGNEKHLRGGEVGKWQRYFSIADIEKIEAILNSFDISLKEFTLWPNDYCWLSDMNGERKYIHQVDFFKQQMLILNAKMILAQSSLKNQEAEMSEIQTQLLNQQLSLSWRITFPLREINLWFKNIILRLTLKKNENNHVKHAD